LISRDNAARKQKLRSWNQLQLRNSNFRLSPPPHRGHDARRLHAYWWAFVDDDPRGLQRTVGEFQADNEDVAATFKVSIDIADPVYRLIASAVTQGKRELGIRIASGAKPRHILAVILTQNAKPTGTGVDFTDPE